MSCWHPASAAFLLPFDCAPAGFRLPDPSWGAGGVHISPLSPATSRGAGGGRGGGAQAPADLSRLPRARWWKLGEPLNLFTTCVDICLTRLGEIHTDNDNKNVTEYID